MNYWLSHLISSNYQAYKHWLRRKTWRSSIVVLAGCIAMILLTVADAHSDEEMLRVLAMPTVVISVLAVAFMFPALILIRELMQEWTHKG